MLRRLFTRKLCFKKSLRTSSVKCSSRQLQNNHLNNIILTACRNFSRSPYCEINKTIETNEKQNIRTHQNGVRLTYGDYDMDLPYSWLRDHCRCKQCFNYESFQRNMLEVPVFPAPVPETVDFDNHVMAIQWKDGHITSYNIEWLIQNSYHERHSERTDRVLWNKDILQSFPLPSVKYPDYMNTDDGLKTHLTNLLQFGFSVVTGVQPTHESTGEVSKRICHIMETFYGHTWQFTTKMDFKDTAYTNLALGAHTDNTYLSSPAGIQVFHVVEHIGEGGQTLLVDGFYAAENLRKHHPEAFETLTNLIIPHEYYDNERHVKSLGSVLTTHPATTELLSIRYNVYDRAPLNTLPANEVRQFYEGYDKLGREITNPDNEFWLKLRPDMVLFVDNWRVLHGRAAFTGSRHVSGLYLPRDDWIAKARSIGLLNN